MNDREIFDMLLEKHPTWMENIKLKGRVDERSRMLAPYDVESIEELIQNVRAKTIGELLKDLCVGCGYLKGTECVNRHCPCDISQSYVVERANNLLEMKGDKE